MAGLNRFARHPYDPGSGSVALGASAIPATAGDTVGFDGHMAELSGHAVHAMENFPVDHNGSPDASPERKHGHIVDVAACPEPLLSESSDLGIVFKKDASAQAAFDLVANVVILPARQIGRLAYDASFQIDDPG